MSFVIGRGRYARMVYPVAAAAAGALASIQPLSREKFVDGGSTAAAPTGSIAAAFKTISACMTAFAPTSLVDAGQFKVALVTQCDPPYGETVHPPAYAITEIRGLSVGQPLGGAIVWNNVAGAFTPQEAALVVTNISPTLGIQVTDDAGAPPSELIVVSQTIGVGNVNGIDTHTTTRLGIVAVIGTGVTSGINCGTSGTSAILEILNAPVNGDISTPSLLAEQAAINSGSITVRTQAQFVGCTFLGAPALSSVLAGAVARFDGPSWASFLGSGGTIGANIVVLITGGYNQGIVPGGALANNADSTVSLDGGVGGNVTPAGNEYAVTGLTAAHSCQIQNSGAERAGDTIAIRKPDDAAFAYTIKNNAGGTIGILPAGSMGWLVARFDGTDWVQFQFGAGVTLA